VAVVSRGDEPVSISVRNVRKVFGGKKRETPAVVALDGISLDFGAAEMHGVIGPEGAGKTTLMRVMLGLLKPLSGEVTYRLSEDKVPFERIRSSIAYMPQQQSLYADLSIEEHLEFFRALYGIRGEEYKKKREELLTITRLAPFVDRPAGKLSGGMYKKLGLMCALLRSPRVLLLDEPTNGVDPISRREFWELLYRLADQNVLIILTTSYMDEAERCAKVHLLEAGKVVTAGKPRALLEREHARSFDEIFLKRAERATP
jgi:ABC-2 type transport system ATP-binding protein